MFAISQKINSLLKTIVFNTKKSKRTFTPAPFNNPQLTSLGILTKPPRSYDYKLPQELPNRHLYWNRTIKNRELRQRYNKNRLQKLQINPIHDSQGNRLYNRDVNQLVSQLGSIRLIKQSVGRTFQNIWEAIQKFPNQFLENGQHSDVLQFAINQIHQRHLATLDFYLFSTYCQIRYITKRPPTETLMLHFYRFLEAATHNKNRKLTVERLGQLANYIFSRQYPQCSHLFQKKTPKFQLFEEGQQRFITFQEILTKLYTQEQLKQVKSQLTQKKIQRSLKSIKKIPGGEKLVEAITSSA